MCIIKKNHLLSYVRTQIVIKIFDPNYSVNIIIRYLYWPGTPMEKIAETLRIL